MDSLKQSSALTDRLLQSRQQNTASKQSQRDVCYHCRQLTKQVEDKLQLSKLFNMQSHMREAYEKLGA